jgi:hypothetical protein
MARRTRSSAPLASPFYYQVSLQLLVAHYRDSLTMAAAELDNVVDPVGDRDGDRRHAGQTLGCRRVPAPPCTEPEDRAFHLYCPTADSC